LTAPLTNNLIQSFAGHIPTLAKSNDNFIYRNIRLLLLTLVLILVWGISSFVSLSRLEDPEINQRTTEATPATASPNDEKCGSIL